jgi:hypothetical protein
VFSQRVHNNRPNWDCAITRFGFRPADLFIPVSAATNMQFAFVEIDILPRQAAQFRTAQTTEYDRDK